MLDIVIISKVALCSYVWLVPKYTTNVDDAVTGFDLFIQENADDSKPDLARGAGGKWRYLVPVKIPQERKKITEIALMRRQGGDYSGPGSGYVGRTQDINRHRGGDFLFLVAKDVEVPPMSHRSLIQEALEQRQQELRDELSRERMQREAAEAAREQMETNWQNGIPPGLASLTREQMAQARSSFIDNKVHIAFVGNSGTGKSTLINSIRGLRSSSPGAAPVNQVECTRVISPYADPRHPHVVWYDVPGAGTAEIRDWQYFMDQKLYAFDALVVVFSDRILQNDLRVLGNAAELGISTFLVRSKSDQIVYNMGVDMELDAAEARVRYIRETHVYVRREIDDDARRVYLVSREGLRRATVGELGYAAALDEQQLLDDLLQAAPRQF